MYYDLNVPWTSSNDPELARIVAFLDELGYDVIALNYTLSGKFNKVTCPIPQDPFPNHPRIRFLRRVTVVLDDVSQNYGLPSLANQFDIVAVRPMTEKILLQACNTLDHDLISFDLSIRHPYHFKYKILGLALARGLKFEICYSSSIHDTIARRNILSNASQLVKATKGKGIIVSSDAKRAAGTRAPHDIINLATLWGLKQDKAKEAVAEACRAAVLQAKMKRTSFRNVINIVDTGGAAVTVVGELHGKRKAEAIENLTELLETKDQGNVKDDIMSEPDDAINVPSRPAKKQKTRINVENDVQGGAFVKNAS